jgi:hypothetical protein
MSSDHKKTFSKIVCFVGELNQIFGSKYDNIKRYYKLLKASMTNPSSVNSHVLIFETFSKQNKESIVSKDLSFCENIKFSDRVFINLQTIYSESDKETKENMSKHLQLIGYLSTGDQDFKDSLVNNKNVSQKIIKSVNEPSNPVVDESSNEFKYINKFAETIKDSLADEDFEENPIKAALNLVKSGKLNNIFSTMKKEKEEGRLDLGKLLMNVQAMTSELKSEMATEGDSKANDTMSLLSNTLTSLEQGKEVDPTSLLTNVKGMMSDLNIDEKSLGGMGGMLSSMLGGGNDGGSDMGLMLSTIMGGGNQEEKDLSNMLKILESDTKKDSSN